MGLDEFRSTSGGGTRAPASSGHHSFGQPTACGGSGYGGGGNVAVKAVITGGGPVKAAPGMAAATAAGWLRRTAMAASAGWAGPAAPGGTGVWRPGGHGQGELRWWQWRPGWQVGKAAAKRGRRSSGTGRRRSCGRPAMRAKAAATSDAGWSRRLAAAAAGHGAEFMLVTTLASPAMGDGSGPELRIWRHELGTGYGGGRQRGRTAKWPRRRRPARRQRRRSAATVRRQHRPVQLAGIGAGRCHAEAFRPHDGAPRPRSHERDRRNLAPSGEMTGALAAAASRVRRARRGALGTKASAWRQARWSRRCATQAGAQAALPIRQEERATIEVVALLFQSHPHRGRIHDVIARLVRAAADAPRCASR